MLMYVLHEIKISGCAGFVLLVDVFFRLLYFIQHWVWWQHFENNSDLLFNEVLLSALKIYVYIYIYMKKMV